MSMHNMKSMKKSESEKKDESMSSVMDRPSYPSGLKIHVSEECYEKLGLSEVPKIGAKMMMLAYVEVTDLHVSERGDDKKYPSVSFQVTDMELQSAKKEDKEDKKDSSKTLYGSAEG